MSQELQIEVFDIENMIENNSIVIISKQEREKNNLVTNLIKKLYYQVNGITIIHDSHNKFNTLYNQFPKDCMHNNYSSKIIINIINHQKQKIKKFKEKPFSENILKHLLILDIKISENMWNHDENFKDLINNAKRYNITYILCVSDILKFPLDINKKFDYIFLKNDLEDFEQTYIYHNYGECFPNFYSFKLILNELSKNLKTMVVHNNPHISNKIYYCNE